MACLEVARKADLESSHHRKEIFVSMDVDWTHNGEHFAIYTNIKSSCCTPETNIQYNVISIIPHFFLKPKNIEALVVPRSIQKVGM